MPQPEVPPGVPVTVGVVTFGTAAVTWPRTAKQSIVVGTAGDAAYGWVTGVTLGTRVPVSPPGGQS